MSKKFSFPDFYDYPPFWTKQPDEETLKKQVELWSNLICAFSKAHNFTEFEIAGALDSPLFSNKKINRQLDRETLLFFLDKMSEKGNAKFTSDARNRVRIYWRSIDEWAKMLYGYSVKYGTGPYTFHELCESDDTTDQPFHKMNYKIMKEAILHLESQGKARFMNPNAKTISEHGVKFL
ncbi:Vacuolar protein-sorting-associated protein 25 [Tritrichomonas foetus]|uniref:Vacuolar protein-sorting-associated protein 25 n=1 Tax=Tritrichomonas foetus TaxID=1144522 RepID=A0A1J4JVJ8_9EUKA|nr:Vacuolar protein-sorting-associated protein 25 [Tritrichomonas foetus]|eukprot:OHT02464.1 Vacuolar protein-sorting-associated protein 25 [Tritrichomonas foetus]